MKTCRGLLFSRTQYCTSEYLLKQCNDNVQSVWYGHASNSDWGLLKIMGRRQFERRDCFDHINMPGGSVRVNSDHNAPAAAAALMVRDFTDEIDYALRQD